MTDNNTLSTPLPAQEMPLEWLGWFLAGLGIFMLFLRLIVPSALHISVAGSGSMTLSQAHAICSTWIGAIAPACPGIGRDWDLVNLTALAGVAALAAGVILIVRDRNRQAVHR